MAKIIPGDSHDTVVRKYADLIEKNNPGKYEIHTSLDGGKQKVVGGLEPDIVLCSVEDSKILTVLEVETAESIDNSQAETRWKPISEGAPAFQLLIPKSTLARARRLSKKNGIKALYIEY